MKEKAKQTMCMIGAAFLTTLFILNAHAAENPLTVTHSLLSSQQLTDNNTELTFELSVSNSSSNPLSDVSLHLMPGIFSLADYAPPLTLGSLAASQTISIPWRITILNKDQSPWPFFQQIHFAVEANDSSGVFLTFPAESMEAQP